MLRQIVLLVEDSPTDAVIVKHALEKTYIVHHARSVAEAQSLLQENNYTIVITDHSLGELNGLDLLGWIAAKGIQVPTIVVSGQGDERVAAEAIKSGAYEYIIKSVESLSSISFAIQHALASYELQRQALILQQIVENASDAIITMDLDGQILTANRAVQTLLGYLPQEVINQPLSKLFPLGNAASNPTEALVSGATGKPWNGELDARSKTGTMVPMHMSVSPLRNVPGKGLCLIGIARDVTERRLFLEKLKRLSITDNLTGLFNHGFFQDRLEYEFLRARRYGQSLGCIMIDADHFKDVNDTYGHLTGDEVLKALADIIVAAARSADIVARYGGEEFAILLPNTDIEGTLCCAKHIWESVGAAEIKTRQGILHLTVSVGVSALTPDIETVRELHRRSDVSLLTAKRRGRNHICAWPDVESQIGAATTPICGKIGQVPAT